MSLDPDDPEYIAALAEVERRGTVDALVMDAIVACPDRGGELPWSEQREGCRGCTLFACGLGKGDVAGRVTTVDCYRCRYEVVNPTVP